MIYFGRKVSTHLVYLYKKYILLHHAFQPDSIQYLLLLLSAPESRSGHNCLSDERLKSSFCIQQ